MVMTCDQASSSKAVVPVKIASDFSSDYFNDQTSDNPNGIPSDRISSASELHPPLVKRYSRTAVGLKLEPKVSLTTVTKYHKLALKYVPFYSKAFEYVYQGETYINESLYIPETHIPVLQRIRDEYMPRDRFRPTDQYIVEWLEHPFTKTELEALLKSELEPKFDPDPIIDLLYRD